ncbi:type II toxin-antitoxin system RelE/ParE family toxin [Sulfuriferula multivorans]|nr:type II toxin-antitoxin system RelE/ParE family toxin [Sulfuriferula multivorans]
MNPLKGDKKYLYSVRVSGNWRITFEFRKGDATMLKLEDYH